MGMTIDLAILRVEHSSMSVDDKETADFIHKYHAQVSEDRADS